MEEIYSNVYTCSLFEKTTCYIHAHACIHVLTDVHAQLNGDDGELIAWIFWFGDTSTSTSLKFSRTSFSSSLPVSLVTTSTGTGGLCSSDWNFLENVKLSSELTRMMAIVAVMLAMVDMKNERLSSSSLSSWRRTWG